MVYFCYETDITLHWNQQGGDLTHHLILKTDITTIGSIRWRYSSILFPVKTEITLGSTRWRSYTSSILSPLKSDITIKPIILRSNTSSILSTLKADVTIGSIWRSSYTSSILSPLKTPAFWAAPPSRMAEMCWRGANSWPLIERSVPPSLTCPRTLNPKPVSIEIDSEMKCLISKKAHQEIHSEMERKTSRAEPCLTKEQDI